jgi:hypothetical protein
LSTSRIERPRFGLRSVAVLAIALCVLAAPHASANWLDPRAPASVFAYRMANGDTLLAWTPTPTAEKYAVYRSSGEPYHKIYEGAEPATIDMDPVNGRYVTYLVTAIARDGSEHSSAVTSSTEGDCVVLTTELTVHLSTSSCMSMVPEL